MSAIMPHVHDWLTYLEVQRNRSPSTLGEYKRDLAALARHLAGDGPDRLAGVLREHGQIDDLTDVTTAHLSAYLVHLKREHEYASATLARRIAAFKSFFAWAAKNRLILADPAADLDVPKVESRIPEDLASPQVHRLLAQVQGDDWLAVRDRALLQLALNTGLRVSEVVHLDLEHLDFTRDQVSIKHPGRDRRVKGGKERVVPLNRMAKVALADWLDRRADLGSPVTGAVFVTRRSRRRMSERAVQMLVAKHAESAGLSNVTPHTLRHTFASRLLDAGADLREVQDLLGHASPATTARYTHKNSEHPRRAVSRLAESPVDRLDQNLR